MPNYRKKSPLNSPVFEAVQLRWDNRAAVVEFLGDALPECSPLRHDGPTPESFVIAIGTHEAVMTVASDYYIIRAVAGGLYSCAPNIFADTCEEVAANSEPS